MVKRCSGCCEEKDLSLFGRNKTRKNGVSYRCKECESARKKKYYTNNKELVAARVSKWRENNHKKFQKKNKDWHRNHPEAKRAANKRFLLKAKHPSVVYFIKAGNYIKIGYTTRMYNRLSSICSDRSHYNHPECGNKQLIFGLCCSMPGTKVEEAEMHEKFKILRYGNSEWFLLSDDILNEINKMNNG